MKRDDVVDKYEKKALRIVREDNDEDFSNEEQDEL